MSEELELWKRLKENHIKSCEGMEARPNSDEYWKKIEEDLNEKTT